MTTKKNKTWRHDDPIPNTHCPQCYEPITYNGNYFCTDYDRCGWALPDQPTSKADKLAFNVAYTELMHLRGQEPNVGSLYRV